MKLRGQQIDDTILALLADSKPRTAKAISKRTGVAFDTVRNHLHTLVILGKLEKIPPAEGVALEYRPAKPAQGNGPVRSTAAERQAAIGSRYKPFVYASLRDAGRHTNTSAAQAVGCERGTALRALHSFVEEGYARIVGETETASPGHFTPIFEFVPGSPDVWVRKYRFFTRSRGGSATQPTTQRPEFSGLYGAWR